MSRALAATIIAGTVLASGAVATTTTAANAATTATGSIVYIHAGNVWLTRPDGSGQRQVTRDGTATSAYQHPTMSDGGVIAVMKGKTIVRMRQDGVVLNRITPKSLFVADGDTVMINPIQDPEISPDGTKIAYSQLRYERYGNGGWYATEAETSFTDAAQWSEPSTYGIMIGWQPAWITNSRVALNKEGDVHIGDLGHDAQSWFWSKDLYSDFVELTQPEVSPDGRRVLFGLHNGGIAMKTATTDPRAGTAGTVPGKPTANPECYVSSDAGKPAPIDATFGPDSDSAVYTEAGDLWVVRGLAACSAETVLTKIATGASEPDWSPAPLSASPAHSGAFALAKAPSVTGKAKMGKRLHAQAGTWSPTPAKVTYAWLRNGKVVRGRAAATYAVGRADRGKRIQVRVTVRRSGFTARTATSRAVTVRR